MVVLAALVVVELSVVIVTVVVVIVVLFVVAFVIIVVVVFATITTTTAAAAAAAAASSITACFPGRTALLRALEAFDRIVIAIAIQARLYFNKYAFEEGGAFCLYLFILVVTAHGVYFVFLGNKREGKKDSRVAYAAQNKRCLSFNRNDLQDE